MANVMDQVQPHLQYEERIAQFFDGLPAEDRDIANAKFSYVAVKKDKIWNLLRGRVDFNPLPRLNDLPRADLDFIRADVIGFGSLRRTPLELLTELRRGQLTIDDRTYAFEKDGSSHHPVDYTRDVYANELNRPVVNRLQVYGRQNNEIWDLAAVQLDLEGLVGFHSSLGDLLTRYGLRPEFGSSGVWFYGWPKAQVTILRRSANRTEIDVAVRRGYAANRVRLVVSSNTAGMPSAPIPIENEEMDRRSNGESLRLIASLPGNDLVDPKIILLYDGRVQHVARPDIKTVAHPNYLSADPAFEVITEGKIETVDPDSSQKVARRKRPRLSVINRLYSMSRNECAYEGCEEKIFHGKHALANVCHITAASEGGPRFDPNQTEEERRGFENLMLLCPTHHALVDRDLETHTVQRLQEMKKMHEGEADASR